MPDLSNTETVAGIRVHEKRRWGQDSLNQVLLIRSLRVPRSAPMQVKLLEPTIWFQVLESKQIQQCDDSLLVLMMGSVQAMNQEQHMVDSN